MLRTSEANASAITGLSGSVVDLRELPAPEPFEQALLHVARLGSGQSVIVWTPRVPQPLLQRLRERSLLFIFEPAPDGSALVYIERP